MRRNKNKLAISNSKEYNAILKHASQTSGRRREDASQDSHGNIRMFEVLLRYNILITQFLPSDGPRFVFKHGPVLSASVEQRACRRNICWWRQGGTIARQMSAPLVGVINALCHPRLFQNPTLIRITSSLWTQRRGMASPSNLHCSIIL